MAFLGGNLAGLITKNELQAAVDDLSLPELLSVMREYSRKHIIDFDKMQSQLMTEDNQNRLRLIGVNTVCPQCRSMNIVCNGKRNNNVQRLQCKDCGKNFTLFTGTFMEKTNFHWSVWAYVLMQILNHQTLETITKNTKAHFKMKSLNMKTVFLMKHKLLRAFSSLPQPVLSGVVQVDETSFRENQKGSKTLISYINGEQRRPRIGRRPSKYGVMGNEWATVCCLVDLNNQVVAKVTGLGKMSSEMFVDIFDGNIKNPAYICSDGNKVYRDYARLRGYTLYVKPSDYLDTIKNAGVKSLVGLSQADADKQHAENQSILQKLYNSGQIDYIYKNRSLTYKQFDAIKQQNSLSLARVNEFHKDLKRYIDKNMTGVSSAYLPDYVSFYVFLRNWKVTHGSAPTTKEDAEEILIMLLKQKVNYTVADMHSQELTLPKASGKYMSLLKEQTLKARKESQNVYFKFDEEDGVATFDRRAFWKAFLPTSSINCGKSISYLRDGYGEPSSTGYSPCRILTRKSVNW